MTGKRSKTWLAVTHNHIAFGHLLDTEAWTPHHHDTAWRPPTDVYEHDAGLTVRVEIAGMCSEDFTISLLDRRLSIAGTRPNGAQRCTYHHMEIGFGKFYTEVHLPWPATPEMVEARYANGFLEVTISPSPSHHVSITGKQPLEE
jgi:HSP20 family protein